jgi:hypothetical protein
MMNVLGAMKLRRDKYGTIEFDLCSQSTIEWIRPLRSASLKGHTN